jgi:hypothetical protein
MYAARMRLRNTVWILLGGVATFVACAASTKDGPVAHAIDAGLDALGVDVAVRDAHAELSTIDEVACTTSGPSGLYAVHAYPGRSAADLARGRALLCVASIPGDGQPLDRDYCVAKPLWVKDGSASVWCQYGATSSMKVQFIMPSAP